ncbi:hypothetical protein FRC07_005330, partial [Ceratobasidium sp. 392]
MASVEDEVRRHIFSDPSFVNNFLLADKEKLQKVVRTCRKSPLYKPNSKWMLPQSQNADRLQPVRRILNTIKAAVDATHGRKDTTAFLDRTDRSISAYRQLEHLTHPDLVMFDHAHEEYEHWETVRMTVAVKGHENHLKSAVAGLCYDARAIFKHQIHRRYLYALAVHGTKATFTRYDRAGVLLSTSINICTESDKFTKAVAALLMMDDETFGFDTSFSTQMGDDRRLNYYVDLPEDILGDGHSTVNDQTGSRSSTIKFKVVECLCHRKDIVGRATIVLRIRQVKRCTAPEEVRTRSQKRKFEATQPEELYSTSYVLKLMWRDPEQEPEGPILSELVGVYGVVQCLWHSDSYWTCKCMRVRGSRCGMCLDETPQVENMMTVQNLGDIENAVRVTDDGQVKCVEINTKQLTPTTETRRRRIYSRILLSSVGKPLWEAEGPRELLTGMLDAIMGCWCLVNMGILHRDVSSGNVMLLPPGQETRKREWLEGPKEGEEISESDILLRERLGILNRDPTGMLSDFDLHMRLTEGSSSASCKSESESESDNGLRPSAAHARSPLAPEPDGRSPPQSKRRRTGDSYVPVSIPFWPRSGPRRFVFWDGRGGLYHQPPASEKQKKTDYRVGTTTFMSMK